MAKYWASGSVKTRLGASIGMDASAELHRVFTEYLCRNLRQTALQRELCVAPDERRAEVAETLEASGLQTDWAITTQGEGDLGTRMSRWFRRNLRERRAAVLIGADLPTLSRQTVDQSTELLIRYDVVIGPAADGGYYLIGLNGPWKDDYQELFREMRWSEKDVLSVTIERITQAGLTLGLLPLAEDVDTIVELKRLIEWLRQTDSHGALLSAIEQIGGSLESLERNG